MTLKYICTHRALRDTSQACWSELCINIYLKILFNKFLLQTGLKTGCWQRHASLKLLRKFHSCKEFVRDGSRNLADGKACMVGVRVGIVVTACILPLSAEPLPPCLPSIPSLTAAQGWRAPKKLDDLPVRVYTWKTVTNLYTFHV